MNVRRIANGRYEIDSWTVWSTMKFRSGNARTRWYGQSPEHPGKMVDAPTLKCAKLDIEKGYFVGCAAAGL